jgi:hypothetical protein
MDNGLYQKYFVVRRDDPDGTHDYCYYFVIDVLHDAFAEETIKFYIEKIKESMPNLAEGLQKMLDNPVYPPISKEFN